jgi:type VI secretion system secreted protein VgrG
MSNPTPNSQTFRTSHANVTFELKLDPKPNGTISIQGLKGREWISKPYRHTVYLTADRSLPLATVIGAKASIKAELSYGVLTVHGIVVEVTGFDPPRADQASGFSYALEIAPRLVALDLHRQNRILGPDNAVSISEIINTVVGGAADSARGPSISIDKQLDLRFGSYRERDFVVQYDESDLAFLSRQCEGSGVFYFFTHDANKETVVFGDDPGVFPRVPATGAPGAPSDGQFFYVRDEAVNEPAVRSFGFAAAAVTSKASLKDYDPTRPTYSATGESAVTNGYHGIHYRFGGLVGGPVAPAKQAQLRAEEHACRRVLFQGRSNLPNLRAGSIFTLKSHPDSAMNRSYLITDIQHVVMAPAQTGFDSPIPPQAYVNEFTCIPDNVAFRPERSTPVPRVFGVHSATVDGPSWGGRAEIDADGRYKVTFLHSMASAARNQGSHYVRKMSPYSGGSDTGLELPLLPGTEVLIAYQNGDIDYPIILGAVPNADTASVVKEANQQYNRLRTPSGIVMELFDGPPPTSTTP